jgi:hypothetical protein
LKGLGTSLTISAILLLIVALLVSGLPIGDLVHLESSTDASKFGDLGPEAPYAVQSTVLQTLKEPVQEWRLPGYETGAQMVPPWAGKGSATRFASAAQGNVLLPAGSKAPSSSNFSYLSAQWTLQAPSQYPSPRTGAAMAFDSALNEVVLFGGRSATGYQNDTWTYQGGTWTNISDTVTGAPSVRYDSLMTYDAADGYLLLVGGYIASGGYQNTSYSFNGNAWQEMASVPIWKDFGGVSDVYGPALAYDALDGLVVLDGVAYDTSFTFHAGAWKRISGQDPCAYVDPLTYDGADGYVLSVGSAAAANYSYATCTYTSASGWAQLSPAKEPAYGGYQLMAYDSDAMASILPLSKVWPSFCSTPFSCSQTWAYNGGVWTNITSLSTLQPSGRTAPGVAFDPVDGYTVLFGGANESVMLGDTWTLKVVTTEGTMYPITFDETGLPSGTNWSVTLRGTMNYSTTSSIGFMEPNGTFSYTVAHVPGYSSSITLGSVLVNGTAPAPIDLVFTPFPIASVAVSPSSANLDPGKSQPFSASPTCTGGSCATAVSYVWQLNNSLASLNTTVGPDVDLVAGTVPGVVHLSVNATLNGTTVMGSAGPITIENVCNSFTVTVGPASALLNPGVSEVFTAGITGSSCGGPVTYSWNMTRPLGTLNVTAGSVVNFTAGPTVGNMSLFVNATQNGTTHQSPSVPINITSAPLPTLSSVVVNPTNFSLETGANVTVSASPSCTGGPCPPGTAYTWALNNSLAGLNSTSGRTVLFSAGTTAGQVLLSVMASLNGKHVNGTSYAVIYPAQPPALSSVAVSPPTDTLEAGENASFAAAPTCDGGPCPFGTSYTWSLNNTLGTLNSTTGQTVLFLAGTTAGQVLLSVKASLNGREANGTSSVVISKTQVPTLSSVTVSPPADMLQVGTNATFTAAPVCNGGPCLPGTSYTWSLNNSLGVLNSTSGQSILFSAGTTAGQVLLSVKASLNGKQANGTSSVVISQTPVPTLSYVIVSPQADTLHTGANATFTAVPVCNGGTCPSGTTYLWSLSGQPGALNSTTGPSVRFTAGSQAGQVILAARGLLNGRYATGTSTINITQTPVPTLTDVNISPTSVTVSAGGSVVFEALPVCSEGTCLAGTTFSWYLSGPTVGQLNNTTSPSVRFLAGSSAGSVTLFVNATLNGIKVQSAPDRITVATSSSHSTPDYFLWSIVAAAIVSAAVVVLVVLSLWRRSKVKEKAPPPAKEKDDLHDLPQPPPGHAWEVEKSTSPGDAGSPPVQDEGAGKQ